MIKEELKELAIEAMKNEAAEVVYKHGDSLRYTFERRIDGEEYDYDCITEKKLVIIVDDKLKFAAWYEKLSSANGEWYRTFPSWEGTYVKHLKETMQNKLSCYLRDRSVEEKMSYQYQAFKNHIEERIYDAVQLKCDGDSSLYNELEKITKTSFDKLIGKIEPKAKENI